MKYALKYFVRPYGLKTLVFQLFMIALAGFEISAQNDTTIQTREMGDKKLHDFSLFRSDEILNVSLYLDLARFAEKPSKKATFDGRMIIHINGADSINRDVTIKYRGISRFEICSFPPIQVNFKQPLYSDSSKIKKLKLVTHCQSSYINDEYVVREYLVYKLFNALTDTSFRVRLLKVSYIDSKMKKKTILKYGIFIEPVEMLAKRTNSTVMKTGTLIQSQIKPAAMDRLAIFNYMIANWDWSVPGQHNVEVLKPLSYNRDGLGVAIPYDFDLTGIVNAGYAIPPPELGIENVRQPIFTGICRTREVYMEDLKRFLDAKDTLYAVIEEDPNLSQNAKKDITNFLDRFFNKLQKQKSTDNLLDKFLETCKK